MFDDLLQYIILKGSPAWENCERPLVVSFSFKQFEQLYSLERRLQLDTQRMGLTQLSPAIIEKTRHLLTSQWQKRAGVDIHFADETTELDPKEMNVVFFLENNISGLWPLKKSRIPGVTALYTTNNQVLPRLKVVSLDKNCIDQGYDLDRNILHESGHALIGEAHFRMMTSGDAPPFLPATSPALDCTNTIMAYQEDCPVFNQAVKKFVPSGKISISTSDPAQQQILRRVYASQPAVLGKYDILAAEAYRTNCTKSTIPSDLRQRKPFKKQEFYLTSKEVSASKGNEVPASQNNTLIVYSKTNSFQKIFEQFTQTFGSVFLQSFCHTIVERYIRLALLSADYEKSNIDLFCNMLKMAINLLVFDKKYASISFVLEHLLPCFLKTLPINEGTIESLRSYMVPALNIGLSLQEGISLEKLLKVTTTLSAAEAGKQTALVLIRKFQKFKSDEPTILPLHQPSAAYAFLSP